MKNIFLTFKNYSFMRRTFLLVFFSFIVIGYLSAQTNTRTSGTDFYVAFGKNDSITAINAYGNLNVELMLRITSVEDTEVSLSFTNNTALNETLTIPAGTIKDYKLTREQAVAAYSGSGSTVLPQSKKSIHVTATNPITLVAINSANNSVDATLVWPVESWGTDYYNIGIAPYAVYNNCNGFIIIAKENNTKITATPRLGSQINATLGAGEVYHYYAGSLDMHRTHIVSDKPVAVFNSNTHGQITTLGINSYNFNFEQLAPVNQWGKKFVLTNNEINAGYFRVCAKEFPTTITYTFSNGSTGSYTFTGLAPEYGTYNIIMDGYNNYPATACYLTSDKPVGIGAFQKTATNGTQCAPSSAWLPPIEQFTRNVLVSPLDLNGSFVYMPTEHYLTIIVPTASKSSTTVSINGEAPQLVENLPNSVFSWKANNIGNSGYSYGQYYIGKSYAGTNLYLNTTLLVDNPDGIIVMAFSGSGYVTYYYTAGSAYRDLTAGFTVNGVNYIDMDWKGICDVSGFTFRAYPDTLTNVVWNINGTFAGTGTQLIKNNLPDGYNIVEMVANNKTYTTHFFVGGLPVVWTPSATVGDENNWNNLANWTPSLVPTSCNNVFIPGNLDYYPNLASAASCNKIYFMQGAELGRPDLLSYGKAYVQYNLGLKETPQETDNNDMNLVLKSSSTADRMLYSGAVSAAPLERERWYMLSSPLKGVVTGDLGFGGFPLTFLKKFGPVNKDNQDYPVGNWTTTYNTMIEPVTANSTDAFAFYMYGYGMYDDNIGCEETGYFGKLNEMDFMPANRNGLNYGLGETNGILELPFFDDKMNLYAHRTQRYDPLTNKSTFFYIDDDTLNLNNLTGKTEMLQRKPNNGNYRFAPESYDSGSGKWIFNNPVQHTVTGLISGEDFLAGNPYMSSIDMIAFCKDNANSIEPEFKIWNGSGFDSYQVDTAGGIISNITDASPYVSPMQGFFLTYKSGAVNFDVKKISTVRPAESSFNLRSARTAAEENILRIKASNAFTSSNALIGYKWGANNGFVRGEDVRKLFSPFAHVPEIYSLAGETPTDINFINNNGNIVVPLGIKTDQTGEIKLTFTGMDNYFKASKIELIDALANKTVDLTGKASYTYSYRHTEKGVYNGRFSLRISNSLTSMPDVNTPEETLNIYGNSKGIYVVSSDPVQKLEVYDFTGRKLYESNSNANYYPLKGNYGNSPLIVKVMTKNSVKTVKIN